MARYENPIIPEGINVSKTHPLVEFAGLIAGVAGIFLCIMATLYLLAGWLLPFVPFAIEKIILTDFEGRALTQTETGPEEQRIQEYLQSLADELIADQGFPQDITLSVHYSTSEQQNAYATLGGNILVNAGVLDAVKSENGLAMVIGHEIGHIVHRDPLMALGRAAVALGAVALLSGFSQTSVANTLFSISTESLLFSFSRHQEQKADDYALNLLGAHYGHARGAEEFFEYVLEQEPDKLVLSEFFSTHPDLEQRVERIRKGVGGDQAQTPGGSLAGEGPDSTAALQPLRIPGPPITERPPGQSGHPLHYRVAARSGQRLLHAIRVHR